MDGPYGYFQPQTFQHQVYSRTFKQWTVHPGLFNYQYEMEKSIIEAGVEISRPQCFQPQTFQPQTFTPSIWKSKVQSWSCKLKSLGLKRLFDIWILDFSTKYDSSHNFSTINLDLKSLGLKLDVENYTP